MKNRIRFESAAKTRDEYGGFSESWTEVATVWAAIEPLNGREFFEARTTNEDTTVRFRIRYRPGLDTDMRIVEPLFGLIYDIQEIIHVAHEKREMVIMATQTNDKTTS